jgi:hypothetical protein
MGSVRTAPSQRDEDFNRVLRRLRRAVPDPGSAASRTESPVLDLLLLAATLVLFALVALVAKGVEKL